MNTIRKIGPVLAVLTAAAFALSACAPTGVPPAVELPQLPQTPDPRTVQVSASGSAQAEPDTLVLLLGVETTSPVAEDAIDENNRSMTAVQDALSDAGIEPEDMQTIQFDVSIERFRPEDESVAVERFRVLHLVQARSGQIEAAGSLLQAALDAGANTVRDVRFTIDDPTELRQQARAQALGRAQAKAEALASGLNAELGPPRRIQEGGSGPVPLQAGVQLERAEAEAPLATGTLTVTVNVDVTFDLVVE